jgi:hypothetical protein
VFNSNIFLYQHDSVINLHTPNDHSLRIHPILDGTTSTDDNTKNTIAPIIAGNRFSLRPNRAMVCNAEE